MPNDIIDVYLAESIDIESDMVETNQIEVFLFSDVELEATQI